MHTASQQVHDATAEAYDRMAHDVRWYPEILFGLCFEQLHPGQRLLAVGIGTGLCAEAFHRYGLEVTGADDAPAMLDVCAEKGIATTLVELDVTRVPWPWPAASFDHVLASGVLHFVDDLAPVMHEAARVVRPGGLVAFTTKVPPQDDGPGPSARRATTETVTGVPVHAHHAGYLTRLLAEAGLDAVKQVHVVVGRADGQHGDTYAAHVTRSGPRSAG